MSVVRAQAIALIFLLLPIAPGSHACGETLPDGESGPECQAAIDWPAGSGPRTQFDGLVQDRGLVWQGARVEERNPATTPQSVPATGPDSVENRIPLNAYWDYGAVLESSDKAFRFHLGGCLEFDNTLYGPTQALPFSLQDGTDMRRARLRADGTIGQNVDFVAEVNFANIQDVTNEDTTTNIGSVGLNDFYADFKQVPVVENLRIGHFKQPIGLENGTGANAQYYMELSDGHDAFFQPSQYVNGIMFSNSYWDDRVTAGLSLAWVGKQTVSPFAFGAGWGECAATGRLTVLPIYEDGGRRLVHLGIDYSYSGTDNNDFYAANRPLVRAGAGSQEIPNILYTGTFYTPNPVQLMNVELATVLGRFSLSAEYQLAHGSDIYNQVSNGVFSGPHGNATYQGFYAETGYFLNPDDYRRYNKSDAVWSRQLQGDSSGARMRSPWLFADHTPVQLLCRYTYLDLASGNPVLTPSSAHRPAGSTTLQPESTGTSIRKSISWSTMSSPDWTT